MHLEDRSDKESYVITDGVISQRTMFPWGHHVLPVKKRRNCNL